MNSRIEEILAKQGPMLSGELARVYEKKHEVTNATARKAISRSGGVVRRSRDIPFKGKQYFVYLEKQYMNAQFCKALLSAIESDYKAGNAFIRAFSNHAGFVSRESLAAYTKSPVGKVSRHMRFDNVLERLVKARILTEHDEQFLQLSSNFSVAKANPSHAKAISIAEGVVLADINDLLRKTNIISYNTGRFWHEYGSYLWGFTSPSYIQGVAMWNSKSKELEPGFIVSDIVLQKEASIADVTFFVEKVKSVRAHLKHRNFITMLIVYGLENDALELLKSENAVIAFIDKVFGNDYKTLLQDLIDVVSCANEIVSKKPELLEKVFDKLVNSDGRYNNVVGALFEFMVANLFKAIGSSRIEINVQVSASETVSGRPKEIDVLVERDGKVFSIECKATKSQIDESFVEKWLSEKVSDTQHYLTNRFNGRMIEHQIWSIGGFTDNALTLLLDAEEHTKKYGLQHFDKEGALGFATKNNARAFIKQVKDHFSLF